MPPPCVQWIVPRVRREFWQCGRWKAIGWNDNIRNSPATHKVAIVALHGVVPFDLATASEVFGWTRTRDQRPAYEIRVCGEAVTVKAGAFDIRTKWNLNHVTWADTVIVPGLVQPLSPVPKAAADCIRASVAAGARVASICTGAFVLAAAGVLDGLRATTHWHRLLSWLQTYFGDRYGMRIRKLKNTSYHGCRRLSHHLASAP